MARTPVSTIAQYAPLTIYVRGQVTFSRIASHVEGQELAKQNQEAAAKGRMPHAKPYTSITIKNPVILDNGRLPEPVKQVVQERFYTKQDGTLMFSQESKSPFLPTVVYSAEAGALAGQGIADKNVPLSGELAVGLDVTVGVSLFSKNGFAGLGMNYILINEPIRYYTSGGLNAEFAAAGITYVPPAQNTVPVTPVAPVMTEAVQTPIPNIPAAPWETETPFAATSVPNVPPATQQAPPVTPQVPPMTTPMPANNVPPAAPTTNSQVARPVRYY